MIYSQFFYWLVVSKWYFSIYATVTSNYVLIIVRINISFSWRQFRWDCQFRIVALYSGLQLLVTLNQVRFWSTCFAWAFLECFQDTMRLLITSSLILKTFWEGSFNWHIVLAPKLFISFNFFWVLEACGHVTFLCKCSHLYFL